MRQCRIMEGFRQYAWVKKFSWPEHNCVSFSLDLIKALWGKEVVLDNFKIRGGTQKEFFRKLLKEKVFLSDLTEKEFGEPLPTTLLARKGDLVIEGEGLEQNMGICYGGGIAYFAKKKGLLSIELKNCTYAWSMK